MHSTGHTSTQAVSFTPTHGSAMMCVIELFSFCRVPTDSLFGPRLYAMKAALQRRQCFVERPQGGADLGVAVGSRDEQRLVGRGRQVDAALEQRVEETGPGAAIRGIDVALRPDRAGGEEEGQ